ncbi:MAG TPA: hypothetical protein VJX67_08455 [Blastocatellia bacterium]|nr:hypothetical protein [Blastocatellia bacterium]
MWTGLAKLKQLTAARDPRQPYGMLAALMHGRRTWQPVFVDDLMNRAGMLERRNVEHYDGKSV